MLEDWSQKPITVIPCSKSTDAIIRVAKKNVQKNKKTLGFTRLTLKSFWYDYFLHFLIDDQYQKEKLLQYIFRWVSSESEQLQATFSDNFSEAPLRQLFWCRNPLKEGIQNCRH